MTVTRMERLENALDMQALAGNGYRYVWYQEISRVGICPIHEYQPDVARLLEARIFSDAGDQEDAEEVHVFGAQDGLLSAVHIVTKGTDPHREDQEMLVSTFGKSLKVRTVYAFDEDGQVYPAVTLLTGYCEMEAE